MWSSWWGGGEKGIPLDKSPKAVRVVPDLEAGGSPTSELPPLEAMEDVADDLENVPLDNALSLYETADALKARLERRVFERKEQAEHVKLADVEGEMNELTMDKDNDESIALTVTKSLENLTRKTVTRASKDSKMQLDAARICQIENRLKNDPSLQIEKKPDGTPLWEFPENPAEVVKKKLIRSYTKIRKSGLDMSMVTMHQLDDRVDTLKRL